MRLPFTLTIWDKQLRRLGWVGNPLKCDITPRHLQVPTANVTVSLSDPMYPVMAQPGTRLTVDFLGLGATSASQIFSGQWLEMSAQGPTAGGTATFTYSGDFILIQQLLGYATPANPANNQPDQADVRSGAAETVLKGYLNANKGRAYRSITVATDQGRGSNIGTVKMRMTPMTDGLLDKLSTANIGIAVTQTGSNQATATGISVDCYVPSQIQRPITEMGGAIRSWSYSQTAPSANAVVIGGPNTGTSREFRRADDTTSQALWGMVAETVADATSVVTDADFTAAGNDALTSAAATSGFSVTLAQTDIFHYGGANGFNVGDLVTMQIGGQSLPPQVLSEVTLSWDRSNGGFTVTPNTGDHSSDPDKKLFGILTNIGQYLRSLKAR